MQGTYLTHSFYHVGGDDADKATRVSFPFPVQLVYISAVCDANTSFVLDVGHANATADPDAYLDNKTVTGAVAPTVFDRADFVGGENIHIPANTVITVAIDHDGGEGTDGANMVVNLLFTEG